MKVIENLNSINFLSFPLHIPSDGEFDGLSIVPIFTSIRGILASIEPLQEMPASNMSSKNARDRRLRDLLKN